VPAPLRILRIITRLNVGGPSYQAVFLTQRLQDAEFETRLLVGNVGADEGSMEPLAAERGVTFTRIPGLGREISLRSDGPVVWRLYREMRRYRPHIVHTHLAKAGAAGRLAAKLAGVPWVVHTYHGHVFHGYFSARKTGLFLRVERTLARWTDRLIVLSDQQRDEILGYGVGRAEQMVRIPLGLELQPFLTAEALRGRFRAQLGVPPDRPLIGIVARLVPIKQHELFLEAARRLASDDPQAVFVVVGDGERRAELEGLAAAAGLAVPPVGSAPPAGRPAVYFTGFRDDLPAIYADLDAFVLCSRNEGLPVAVIEALAAARPVVATDVGAVRDLVRPEETGVLTPPGDAHALAAGLSWVLRHPAEAAARAEQGRRHVYPRLSIDRLEGDIRALYRELAGSRGSHA
jgi:glycosyltransferase involved in cell wall biosynthesis